MKLILHAEQLLPFALEHPAHRYACPFRNYLRDVLRSHRLGNDRILDGSLTGCQLIDLLLRLGHLSITDLRHLSIVSGSLRVMSLNLVILHLLSLRLKLRKDALLLVPALAKLVALSIQGLQLFLDLVHLQGNALPLDSLTLDLQLAYAAVQLSYRLRHGIHLQTKL